MEINEVSVDFIGLSEDLSTFIKHIDIDTFNVFDTVGSNLESKLNMFKKLNKFNKYADSKFPYNMFTSILEDFKELHSSRSFNFINNKYIKMPLVISYIPFM